ncbi:MAG: stage II sporulation protein D [Oscillospiraceae bacterium]|jgi:stage II sporulation protein D|nr:stage II sporulation protein D [Oscillospiraceae bacterium]
MKKYLLVLAVFAVLLLGIPSAAFLKDSMASGTDKAVSQNSTSPETSETSGQPQDASSDYLMLDTSTGKVLTVTQRDYIIGAVSAEMPAAFHPEALKAQAIAVHTYAERQKLKELQKPTAELNGAYFSNDPTRFQAFFTDEKMRETFGEKYEENYAKISAAADEVLNKIIVYQGEPIVAAFHSLSSGNTENSSDVWDGSPVDYLVSKPSLNDVYAPKYEQEYQFTPEEIAEKFKAKYPDLIFPELENNWFYIDSVTDAGSVKYIIVGDKTIRGREFREILGLRSACFEVKFNKVFTVTTRGYGHGVGMSQYGANFMANSGILYDEILKHYYTGVEIIDTGGNSSETDGI